MRKIATFLVGLGLALVAQPSSRALAGESQLELTTGGLEFGAVANPAALTLKLEELRLSPKVALIRYQLANTGAEPLELPYGFKFPDLDYFDPDVDYAIPGTDPLNFLGVVLRLDGKPQALKLIQRATLDNKDVSGALHEAKLSLVPVGAFQTQLAQTDAALREKLKSAGLIVESGTSADGTPLFFPTWSVKTSFSGKLAIPPGHTVSIELKYLSSLGSSPDSVLRKALRDQPGLRDEVAKRRADYCIDPPFLAGLDKISGEDEANRSSVKELRMHFRTAHGGGIGAAQEYRLMVDKEIQTRIVSFCADNLKAVNRTQFEARAHDFAPSGDLKILLIDGKPKAVAKPQ